MEQQNETQPQDTDIRSGSFFRQTLLYSTCKIWHGPSSNEDNWDRFMSDSCDRRWRQLQGGATKNQFEKNSLMRDTPSTRKQERACARTKRVHNTVQSKFDWVDPLGLDEVGWVVRLGVWGLKISKNLCSCTTKHFENWTNVACLSGNQYHWFSSSYE